MNPDATRPAARRGVPLAGILVLPFIPVIVWLAGSTILGALDRDPFWRQDTFTVSEAIMRGDYGQAFMLIQEGRNPNAGYAVPRELPGHPGAVTPLDAAAYKADIRVVETLLQSGANPDDTERLRASCIAVSREAKEISKLLVGRVVTAGECAAAAPPKP